MGRLSIFDACVYMSLCNNSPNMQKTKQQFCGSVLNPHPFIQMLRNPSQGVQWDCNSDVRIHFPGSDDDAESTDDEQSPEWAYSLEEVASPKAFALNPNHLRHHLRMRRGMHRGCRAIHPYDTEHCSVFACVMSAELLPGTAAWIRWLEMSLWTERGLGSSALPDIPGCKAPPTLCSIPRESLAFSLQSWSLGIMGTVQRLQGGCCTVSDLRYLGYRGTGVRSNSTPGHTI